jgi:DeoR/GlpR family transcriptional regulator of sugar metabolism
MLAPERLSKIVEITNQREIVTVDELIDLVGASKATIRRDIRQLADNGLIRKTHGGVMSISMGATTEPPLRVKSNLYVEEKKRIAAKAVGYLADNDFIILDSGTTVLEFAKLLNDRKKITAVTYDLLVAMEIAKNTSIDLMMIGGTLRKTYYSFFGFFAESMLRQLTANKAFIAVDSVDLRQGLMSYTTDDIAIKKLIVDSSKEVILLSDHSKFDNHSYIKICDLSSVDRIITGTEINQNTLFRLREMGIAVETV